MAVTNRERTDRDRSTGSKALWWVVGAALALIALAVILFFALGGDVATDTEGEFDVDVETPESEVDVAPPDVDLEAPDVDVDPGNIDIDDAEAEADVDG